MKTCPFCNNKFNERHGNQLYCSAHCKKLQKGRIQKKLYGLLKDFRSGFINNLKLFEELLPRAGKQSYSLNELTNRGFKPHCYYMMFIDNTGITWHAVGNYSHCITKKDQGLIVTVLNNK